MSRVSFLLVEGCNPVVPESDELVYLEARRHGIVLVRPLSRAVLLALLGVVGFAVGWPLSLAGAALLLAAAAVAVAAVWRWDRTHVVLTAEQLFVVDGVVRRRAASVRLARVSTVELDQSLLGRLLGYGTVVAGDLEIRCVPHPRELCGLVQRLAG
jgi:membrane protein YdbS with pleckstrin-like domain